jgi:RNA-directed DNA polymerase
MYWFFKVKSFTNNIHLFYLHKILYTLIINENSVGIGKKKYKDLRAKIHHLTLPNEQKNEKLLYHVGGWLSYLNSVDKERLKKAKKYIRELTKKHPTTLIAKLYQ